MAFRPEHELKPRSDLALETHKTRASLAVPGLTDWTAGRSPVFSWLAVSVP